MNMLSLLEGHGSSYTGEENMKENLQFKIEQKDKEELLYLCNQAEIMYTDVLRTLVQDFNAKLRRTLYGTQDKKGL